VGDPEVVDVAVRLLEVAVAVAVVAVGDIDLGEVDAAVRVRRRESRHGVLDDLGRRAERVIAARSARLQVRLVVRERVRERDPVRHLALPGELPARELQVEVPHRRIAVRRAARAEEHVAVVLRREVRDPVRAVVDCTVRLRDRVVLAIAVVDEHDRQLLRVLELVLDEAAVRQLDHTGGVRRGLATRDEVGGEQPLVLPLLDELRQRLHVAAGFTVLPRRRSPGCRRIDGGARRRGQQACDRQHAHGKGDSKRLQRTPLGLQLPAASPGPGHSSADLGVAQPLCTSSTRR